MFANLLNLIIVYHLFLAEKGDRFYMLGNGMLGDNPITWNMIDILIIGMNKDNITFDTSEAIG